MPIETHDKTSNGEGSLTEIESFFGKNEEKINSSTKFALVICMVMHSGLCKQYLKDLESTNARDLIRCLAMEKYHNCCVKTSIALDNGGIDDMIEGHQIINVKTTKSMENFFTLSSQCL